MSNPRHEAYNYALDLLSYRARSTEEIRRRLNDKGFGQQVIADTVEKLKVKGFLDDVEFARWWIENRLRTKPMGIRRLRAELKEKGVARGIIENLCDDLLKREEQKARAEELAHKRYRRYRNLEKKDAKRRLHGFLARRGFLRGIVYEAVHSALAADEDRT